MNSKSTFSNTTSKSYALALYELSKESSELDKVEKEVEVLNKLLNESKDFREMITNPTINKEDKKNIISEITNYYKFSEILKKFLNFMAMKNRLFFLKKIIDSFLNLVFENKGELKAKLISSKELSIDEQKKIQDDLSENFKSPLKIDYIYNPDLIAGLIVQIGSVMIDTSIKTKLKKLEKNMIEA